MTFNDDELRVLHGMIQINDWPISGKVLKRLLARLEAAEACAKALNGHCGLYVDELNLLKVWRKACGK